MPQTALAKPVVFAFIAILSLSFLLITTSKPKSQVSGGFSNELEAIFAGGVFTAESYAAQNTPGTGIVALISKDRVKHGETFDLTLKAATSNWDKNIGGYTAYIEFDSDKISCGDNAPISFGPYQNRWLKLESECNDSLNPGIIKVSTISENGNIGINPADIDLFSVNLIAKVSSEVSFKVVDRQNKRSMIIPKKNQTVYRGIRISGVYKTISITN